MRFFFLAADMGGRETDRGRENCNKLGTLIFLISATPL